MNRTMTLDVPFADVQAGMLRWTLAPTPVEHLASREITVWTEPCPLHVTLAIVGASHQVIVRRGAQVLLTETVAWTTADDAVPLPTSVQHGSYELVSTVTSNTAEQLFRAVGNVKAELAENPHGILGCFPGQVDAITALLLEHDHGGSLRWSTWHSYPQTGELVITATRFHVGKEEHFV